MVNESPAAIWLDDLKVGLGVGQGQFRRVTGYWLRWCDAAGDWMLTDTKQEGQRADRLAEPLRELGVDPENL